MSEFDYLESVKFRLHKSDCVKLKRLAARRQQPAAQFMRHAVVAAIRAEEIEEECELAKPRLEPWRKTCRHL